jgi:hypothetical protein
MPNALRIGLLGPLRLPDTAGRVVPVDGRQLRVLLTLLALNAGRVVPTAAPTSRRIRAGRWDRGRVRGWVGGRKQQSRRPGRVVIDHNVSRDQARGRG